MGKSRALLIALLLIVMSMMVPTIVLASSPIVPFGDNGVVQIGQDWTLQSGEHLNGDVLVIDANATIEQGAILEGDMAVISGNAVIAGKVKGNISVVNGDVILQDGSRVIGDVAVVSGNVQKAPTAVIEGEVLHNQFRLPATGAWNAIGRSWSAPQPGSPQWFLVSLWRLIVGIVSAVFSALVAALIAAVVVIIWPFGVRRIAETAAHTPLVSFLIGLLTSIAILVLVIILAITICLLPFALLLLLFWIIVSFVGWTAIGAIVGNYVWESLHIQSQSDILPTAVGVFLLSLLSSIPCIGTLFGIAMAGIGVGAVLLSQFGQQVPRSV